jgi:hypothetical protein
MIGIRLPIWLLLLLAAIRLPAQQFGGNPPSLKWRQINTDTARIIFPAGLETQAEQVAAIVHRLARATIPTIGGRQKKIDIVLQDQTIIPNGYVGLAPFRSEFQLTPEQNSFDLGSLPWQKMLAIHEYRHVQQYNNFRVGLSRVFYYLFGEGGQALANALAIPNWFWEGDAVYQETLVSEQGRGRLPLFFSGYHSLWAGDKHYSWMKLRNGSLRDYVPDHYPLGYMLVAFGREKYGDQFWKNVTHEAASFSGLFYPLQRAIERQAGISFSQFRRDALDHFRAQTSGRTDEYAKTHRHFVADEEFPQWMDQGKLLYMRSSYKRIPAFVIRGPDRGKEVRVDTRAMSLDNYFSYKNGLAVYAAYETDPRWSWKDFSVIRVLDASTGEDTRITSRSRYFSPDISADGRQIIAVEEATDGSCTLLLLNSRTGAIEQTIPNKDTLFYTYPKFYTDGKIATAVRNTKGEMALAVVDIRDGSAAFITPFSFQTIGMPSIEGDTIWFTASREGRDQVFAAAGGHLFRLKLPEIDPSTGQYAFQASGKKYSWTDPTAVGYTLNSADRDQTKWEELSAEKWDRPMTIQGIDSLDKGPAHLLDRITTGSYPVRNYPGSFRLFNFHSWRPYINDPNYRFSLVSENILNTLQSEAYVGYNRNEQYKQFGVDATYGALFPMIDAGWDYIFDRNTLVRYNQGRQTHFGLLFWNEMDSYAGVSIPLYYVRGKSSTSLRFGADLVYEHQSFTGYLKSLVQDGGFTYLRSFVSLAHQIRQAQQQIYPRFAQTLSLSYDRAANTTGANQLLASGYLYLPGLFFTHNLVLGAAWQGRDLSNAGGFSNAFPFSRGYTAENFYHMYRLAANYDLPLFYPDWGMGNMLYFLRIRANLFYDYTHVEDFSSDTTQFLSNYRSVGAEIYFDTKWWNQLPISFGIRYSHLLDPDFAGGGPNQWELILPLNLLSQSYNNRSSASHWVE